MSPIVEEYLKVLKKSSESLEAFIQNPLLKNGCLNNFFYVQVPHMLQENYLSKFGSVRVDRRNYDFNPFNSKTQLFQLLSAISNSL